MTTPGNGEPELPGSTDVAAVGERRLIDHIRRRLPPAPASLVVGIGDDAAVAVVDRGALQVLTTDALVEGVHFDRRFSSPADIGYKALAVNVSDVAAMGGAPRLALLSLMLPPATPLADVDGLLDGLLQVAAATGVTLAGGNISRSPGPLVVDVTVTGSRATAADPDAGRRTSGRQPLRQRHDRGGSRGPRVAARARRDRGRACPRIAELAECVARHRRPEPRARLGALLGRTRAARACMDLSDGLADAVRQIAEASGAGAKIDAERAADPRRSGALVSGPGRGPRGGLPLRRR